MLMSIDPPPYTVSEPNYSSCCRLRLLTNDIFTALEYTRLTGLDKIFMFGIGCIVLVLWAQTGFRESRAALLF